MEIILASLIVAIFVISLFSFLLYVTTLFRLWFRDKSKPLSQGLALRRQVLVSLYGRTMQSGLLLYIVFVFLSIYYIASHSSHLPSVIEDVLNENYLTRIIVLGIPVVFVVRLWRETKGRMVGISKWMVFKEEVMLPGSFFVVVIILWGLLNLLATSVGKPVIYLYPETTTEVTVRLDFDGEIIADYPPYDYGIGGWEVTAEPDGTLTNHANGHEYSYLFWEGETERPVKWDLSRGFVVPGDETREFLQEKLSELGLTPKEYNEFIVYWYPLMMDNPYNLIHFAGEQYTDAAPLTILPTPDSMLRVFMVFKPLTKHVEIEPQDFESFTRNGFTVVEWGGTEIR